MKDNKIQAGSKSIEVSSLEKLYFPEQDINKGDLLEYYQRITERMLPYLEDRPLTMERYPDGIEEEGFYQKEAPEYFPDWIRRVDILVKEEGQEQPQVVCQDQASLLYLVNQGCITFHPWLSRADRLEHPDRMIFDLDPPDGNFDLVRFAARALREALTGIGIDPFLMTTGSRGLHIVIPLDREADFDAVRGFARELANRAAARHPDRLTTAMKKDQRGNRLFLDYLRNSYGQNSVAPYTLRPLPGAPVATPLRWDELSDPELHSQSYTIANIFRRLGQIEDPWKTMLSAAHSLGAAASQLDDPPDELPGFIS